MGGRWTKAIGNLVDSLQWNGREGIIGGERAGLSCLMVGEDGVPTYSTYDGSVCP